MSVQNDENFAQKSKNTILVLNLMLVSEKMLFSYTFLPNQILTNLEIERISLANNGEKYDGPQINK